MLIYKKKITLSMTPKYMTPEWSLNASLYLNSFVTRIPKVSSANIIDANGRNTLLNDVNNCYFVLITLSV